MSGYGDINILQKAIPAFVVILLVELLVNWRSSKKAYRFGDTIANLSTTLLFSLCGLVFAAGYAVVHTWVGNASGSFTEPLLVEALPYTAAGGWNLPALGSFLIVLVLVDFLYYWFHRAAHEINFLWACHVTHHSSEEFNYSVALRQCAFQRLFEYAFMLPLAFLGVSWYFMLFCHGILKIYQFWVHTRYIPKLGILEYVILTPSHHRIHHASDPKYLDKNHGGILIIWDRLFGTFAEEEEEPTYGLTKNIESFNPIWMNVHHYAKIWQDLKATPTFMGKLKVLCYGPGWKYTTDDSVARLGGPKGAPAATEMAPEREKFIPGMYPKMGVYLIGHFLLTTVVALVVLRGTRSGQLEPMIGFGLGLFILVSLLVVNAFTQGKRWAFTIEPVRLALFTLPGLLAGNAVYTGIGAAVWIVSYLWMRKVAILSRELDPAAV